MHINYTTPQLLQVKVGITS